MGLGIFALALWVLASVPLGLLLGWACGLNKLSRDARDVRLGDILVRSRKPIGTRPDSGSPPSDVVNF